ncbi:DinB family protein [Cohnella endophytica]|uniref:DinB family protein n=1 Tax=Cohnella endophytica TaxID=2419778 RepID=A0A494XR91_9BACL|nr:DinB family protein [Cohnella endophytica]RKP53150.1 DinB family protein [Cohnella endophytica]
MNEEQVFEQFRMWRSWTIDLVESLDEALLDDIPTGFSNNIRWNIGHILVGWDHAVFTNIQKDRQLSLQYHTMFPRGSMPSLWVETPPSLIELRNSLSKQQDDIVDATRGQLDRRLVEPFLHMNTIGEIMLFQLSHEALHAGVITGIRRCLV